ncbi:MAG: alpha-L-arabinofuranosidase C-terminal domain-containing protein [Clostridia bacterium]|nr:alpha-L-arabinofuranosidase C-terminal domain-containing protein [Clostridia bacterium]
MKSTVKINIGEKGARISRYIYGHFAEHLGRCIYDGFWVGKGSVIPNASGIRLDIVEALRQIKIPVLRWPGGCFADEYHWMDGIGPARDRKRCLNTHWGMVTETHDFGTHEFFELCEMLGCDAYVAGNLGSGTVREMQDWVDYISCAKGTTMSALRKSNGREEPWKLPFFGIGNENWACGGNMRPEYYTDLYRRYQTYIKNYPGSTVRKVACGPNEDDYEWTDIVMNNAGKYMWGLSMHYYTRVHNNFETMGYSDRFGEEEWYSIIKYTYLMDEYIKGHAEIMDKYDPDGRVALIVDEWGTWYKAMAGTNRRFLHQQNTIRDAVSAAIHFNIFHSNCGRVRMANLAQTVNVLQAVILTYEDVMIKTPTYHVFDLYKCHQDNIYLPPEEAPAGYRDLPAVSSTASLDEETGTIYYSACNSHPHDPAELSVTVEGVRSIETAKARIVAGNELTSHNTAENPQNVTVADFNGIAAEGNVISCTLPPRCVVTIEINL